MKKYILILTFLISQIYYWLIASNLIQNQIILKNGFFEFLHYFNVFFVFPAFLTFVIMYFYKKKKKSDFWDYILLIFVFSFGSATFNGLIEFLSFEFCETKEIKTLFENKENSTTIVFRETRCGVVGRDADLVELKSPHLFIFNKYEEVDTNTLDLTNWTKL